MRSEKEIKGKIEQLENHKYEDNADYYTTEAYIDALEWVLGEPGEL